MKKKMMKNIISGTSFKGKKNLNTLIIDKQKKNSTSLYISAIVTMLAGLSFACLNANSLNMSSSNKEIQLKKILGISKLCTDVIFLSDV
jgi:hypothetical protein